MNVYMAFAIVVLAMVVDLLVRLGERWASGWPKPRLRHKRRWGRHTYAEDSQV